MSGDRIVDVDALDLRGGAERAENDLVFGILTSTGYLFIIIVLMVGIVLGDTPTLTVSLCYITSYRELHIPTLSYFQLLLFNFFGFVFFIALGSEQIYIYNDALAGEVRI